MPSRILLACLLFWVASPISRAQESDLRFVTVARSPQTRVLPGSVLMILAKVANVGDSAAEGIVVASVDGRTDHQSARRVIVSPGGDRQFNIYVNLPSSIAGKERIDVELAMMVSDGSREVMLDRDGAPVKHSLTYTVNKYRSLPGLVLDAEPPLLNPWSWPKQIPYSSYELPMGARIDAGEPREMANYNQEAVPASLLDLEALDLVIVSEASALADAASVEALKRFVSGGRRVWLMLDKLPSELSRGLLGAGQSCETIDEVEINHFVVDALELNAPMSVQDRTVSLDNPIRMKRVVQTGGRVSHEVDGWPVAIWMPVGYGEVLLTTLDSQAWIEVRTEQLTYLQRFQSFYETAPWAKEFASTISEPRTQLPLDEELEYPLKHIGNPVVPRSWVATALLSFCGLILAAGLWRWLAGDLSWLGIIAPVLSVVMCVGLALASGWVRRDIPERVSKLQLIEFAENGRSANVREQAAVFLDSSRSMALASNLDGRAIPGDTVSTGIKRFVVDDFQSWRMENEAWPPGTWRYRANYNIPADGLYVEGRLSQDGLELYPPSDLPSQPLQDTVLAYVPGDPIICSQQGDHLLADGQITADGERWISGTLISDEQQRRTEVYRNYFEVDPQRRPLRSMLLGWTSVWENGPKWSEEFDQAGAALVALPVRLQRPKAGTNVYIPHGLIQIRRNRDAVDKTFAYNDRTGAWSQGLTMGVGASLQFVLPPEAVPLKATKLDLELDIRAPNRVVRILETGGSEPIEIARVESPSLPVLTTVTDQKILDAAGDGVLNILLEVSERTDVDSSSATTNVVEWDVHHFHLNVTGVIESKSALAQEYKP